MDISHGPPLQLSTALPLCTEANYGFIILLWVGPTVTLILIINVALTLIYCLRRKEKVRGERLPVLPNAYGSMQTTARIDFAQRSLPRRPNQVDFTQRSLPHRPDHADLAQRILPHKPIQTTAQHINCAGKRSHTERSGHRYVTREAQAAQLDINSGSGVYEDMTQYSISPKGVCSVSIEPDSEHLYDDKRLQENWLTDSVALPSVASDTYLDILPAHIYGNRPGECDSLGTDGAPATEEPSTAQAELVEEEEKNGVKKAKVGAEEENGVEKGKVEVEGKMEKLKTEGQEEEDDEDAYSYADPRKCLLP